MIFHETLIQQQKGFAMLNDMIEEQNNTMILKEPESVADWDHAILDTPFPRPKPLSGKTYAIRLLHEIFKEEEPSAVQVQILKETIRDYPELANEVKEQFPHIFE